MDKYFNGKIRCVEAKSPLFTKSKIYEVKRGRVYHILKNHLWGG